MSAEHAKEQQKLPELGVILGDRFRLDEKLAEGGMGAVYRARQRGMDRDVAIKVLLDKELEGFGEIFRMLSYEEIGTSSLQSRAIAGVANGTYVFCLPGSSGACATGWDRIISHQLDHRTRPCNLVELMPRLKEI